MIDLNTTNATELANALYDCSGELVAHSELVLFVLNNSTRDLSQANGPIHELTEILANTYKGLGWGKLEYVTAVLTALDAAVNDKEYTGYVFSDNDFASVGYTQEVHLRQLCLPLMDGFQYSEEPAGPAPDTNMDEWLTATLAQYMQDPEQDYLKAPLAAARAKHLAEPEVAEYSAEFLQLRSEATDYIKQGWLDDDMLEDAVGDALAKYVYGKLQDMEDDTSGCEPNADYENPASY